MRVSDAGEFGLIAELREMLGGRADDLVMPPGDDAAVFRSPSGSLMAFTTDAMVEGIHFDPSYVSWHSLGYKSLAVNLSDLAAMGGRAPSFALVVLGLRADTEVEAIRSMYEGMIECAREFSCHIAGGDIVRSPKQTFVSVSLAGALGPEGFLKRSGARPGQSVMVTGTLGESYLGLKWLMREGGVENQCAKKHLYPRPRLQEGRRALELEATAGIDVSDGLLRDLGHICEESKVGARIMADKIPLSTEAVNMAGDLDEDPLGAALYGGEDYELILVAGEEDALAMQRELSLTLIGEITEGSSVRVVNSYGQDVELGKIGYDHFKES